MTPEPARGRHQALTRAQAQYEPFPDGRIDMIGTPLVSLDGFDLACRWRFLGTHLRRIDPPGFAPTGQQVVVEGTSVLHFRDGQVNHVRQYFDTTDVARQLLAAPPAGSPARARHRAVTTRPRAPSPPLQSTLTSEAAPRAEMTWSSNLVHPSKANPNRPTIGRKIPPATVNRPPTLSARHLQCGPWLEGPR